MYKSDQQWITLNTAQKEDVPNTETVYKSKTSLIDAFTADIDNPNTKKLESFQVNGEVGTLIAQKLLKGEKMRICRNGEPIHPEVPLRSEYSFMLENLTSSKG